MMGISKQLRNEILSKSDFCTYCRRTETDGIFDWHIDHIVPKSKGGTDERENLCKACMQCNLSKGSKDPVEFFEEISAHGPGPAIVDGYFQVQKERLQKVKKFMEMAQELPPRISNLDELIGVADIRSKWNKPDSTIRRHLKNNALKNAFQSGDDDAWRIPLLSAVALYGLPSDREEEQPNEFDVDVDFDVIELLERIISSKEETINTLNDHIRFLQSRVDAK
jgi:hypothetical protein